LRERRRLLGLSQAQLAARMGFTPPQINRYEHGTTRLSAAALWRAAQELDVTPGYFFEGLGQRGSGAETQELEAISAKLVQHMRKLAPPIRDKVLAFIASLSRS
jgi:transcriptional regulator with XRE-family HTH domain